VKRSSEQQHKQKNEGEYKKCSRRREGKRSYGRLMATHMKIAKMMTEAIAQRNGPERVHADDSKEIEKKLANTMKPRSI
jgi:hypothetical protein